MNPCCVYKNTSIPTHTNHLAATDAAYRWLCQQRKDYPQNADIWSFRFEWEKNKSRLLKEIVSGDYGFSPLARIRKQDGQVIHIWCSSDTLVKSTGRAFTGAAQAIKVLYAYQRTWRPEAMCGRNSAAVSALSVCLQNRC